MKGAARTFAFIFVFGMVLGALAYWGLYVLGGNFEEKIRERLRFFGYPDSGYIIAHYYNDTYIIRFSTGQAVILTQNGVITENLKVTPFDAYNAAYNYLIQHPRLSKAIRVGYVLEILPESLEEYQDESGRYWWRFKVVLKGKGVKMPFFVMVDREDPAVVKYETVLG